MAIRSGFTHSKHLETSWPSTALEPRPPCRRPVPAPHGLADRPTSGCQRNQWSPAAELQVWMRLNGLYTSYIPMAIYGYMYILIYIYILIICNLLTIRPVSGQIGSGLGGKIGNGVGFAMVSGWPYCHIWLYIIIYVIMIFSCIKYCNIHYQPALNIVGSTESIL